MVGRGLNFLLNGGPGLAPMVNMGGGHDVGAQSLIALAFVKSNKADHAIVKSTVKKLHSKEINWMKQDNYSLCLGIILLSEVSEKERDAAVFQKIVDELLDRQKPHGGFGYDGRFAANVPTGDTSQTQYAVLAMWGARLAQANVPQEAIEKVCDWLVRTQDPSGAWGYQGIDPGSYERVSQAGANPAMASHSLAAAGLGSVCICADLLGIHRPGALEQEEEHDPSIPGVLKVVKKPKPASNQNDVSTSIPLITKLDPAMIHRAIEDGSRWFAQNYLIETKQAWNLYYLYGLERCESFRGLYYRKFPKDSQWYNDGVTFLGRTMKGDHWSGDHADQTSTAFCILFLQRSAQKQIIKKHKDLGEGVLSSGKGLPTDLANASVKRGKVVDSPLAGEIDDVLAMLNDEDNPELARLLEGDEEIRVDPELIKRSGAIAKLREKVRTGSWEARMVSVKSLGQVRDLDNVPVLLYALTDPDVRVVQAADAALRFISRKFQGVGLPAEPDRKALQDARNAWRSWYLSIRPNAELLD